MARRSSGWSRSPTHYSMVRVGERAPVLLAEELWSYRPPRHVHRGRRRRDARKAPHAQLVGGVVQYKDACRLSYIRGHKGHLIGPPKNSAKHFVRLFLFRNHSHGPRSCTHADREHGARLPWRIGWRMLVCTPEWIVGNAGVDPYRKIVRAHYIRLIARSHVWTAPCWQGLSGLSRKGGR